MYPTDYGAGLDTGGRSDEPSGHDLSAHDVDPGFSTPSGGRGRGRGRGRGKGHVHFRSDTTNVFFG